MPDFSYGESERERESQMYRHSCIQNVALWYLPGTCVTFATSAPPLGKTGTKIGSLGSTFNMADCG